MSHGRNGHLFYRNKNYWYKKVEATSRVEIHAQGALLFSYRYKEFTDVEMRAAIDEYYRAKEFGRNRVVPLKHQPTNDFDGVDVIYPD